MSKTNSKKTAETQEIKDGAFRVYWFPKSLWAEIKSGAAAKGLPLRKFLSQSIIQYLPSVVENLATAGVRAQEYDHRSRIELTSEAMDAIKTGRDQTGLPGTLCMMLALQQAIRDGLEALTEEPAEAPIEKPIGDGIEDCPKCGHSLRIIKFKDEKKGQKTCPDCGWRKAKAKAKK